MSCVSGRTAPGSPFQQRAAASLHLKSLRHDVQSLFKLLALQSFAMKLCKMEKWCFLVFTGSARRKIASS